jgi:hypothetical protein
VSPSKCFPVLGLLAVLAGVLLPAANAGAARTSAVEATGRTHRVVTFRLPNVAPNRVTGATLRSGKRRERVSVKRVRKALRKTRVLSVRSRLRGRRIKLLMKLRDRGRTRPDTRITGGPTGTVDTRSATFRFDSSRKGVRYECRLDSGSWNGCPSPKTVNQVSNGDHVFAVRARIRGGLADSSAATRRFSVDAPVSTTPLSGRRPAPKAPAQPAVVKPAPGLTDRPAPTSGNELLRDDFSGDDGLITNGYAYWDDGDDDAFRSSIWEQETASFFRRANTGWSGLLDGAHPDRTSSNGTGSQMFRMWTKRSDFDNVLVTMRLQHEGYGNGSGDWSAHSWDGLKLWLRRGGRTGSHNLYTVEVNRRENNVMIQKKCAGSDEYHILDMTSKNSMPATNGWESVGGSVKTNPDGTVTVELIRNGRVVLDGTDDGVGGCAPITEPGRVGIRGDNTQFSVDDFVVAGI